MTPADHCDLTVHEGAPAIRLRNDHGDDLVHPLTPSEAAALISKLARTLTTYLAPPGDRTDETQAHPDYQEPTA